MFLHPCDFPGKNTGVACHFLLQIFPTQGLNLGLLHCRQTLYRLSHQGNLRLPRSVLKTLYTLGNASSSSCLFALLFSLSCLAKMSFIWFCKQGSGSAPYICTCVPLWRGSLGHPFAWLVSINPLVLNWRSLALGELPNSRAEFGAALSRSFDTRSFPSHRPNMAW